MKKYFSFLFISFFIFSCKNEEKQNIIAAPSAKARITPHQNGEEQFSLDKGTKVEIIGISSNIDTITIGEKKCIEHWYLIKSVDSPIMKGWVYGGYIEFGKNIKKEVPKWDKILKQKKVDVAPCFENFRNEENEECNTDCKSGVLYFFDDTFLKQLHCMEGDASVISQTGNYKIIDNTLILNILEYQEQHYKSNYGEPSHFLSGKGIEEKYEIHYLKDKPIFIYKNEKGEKCFLGNPETNYPDLH